MATTPATKKRIASSNSTFTVLKKASCPTLSLTGNISYEISRDKDDLLYVALTKNSGKGYFSKNRVLVTEIITTLEQFQAKHPLTSLALKDLYPGTSINSWSFLMAVLLAEGLVIPNPDQPRRFLLNDPEDFLASLDTLKTQHSGPTKRKPKAKAKASSRMRKTATKPATGK